MSPDAAVALLQNVPTFAGLPDDALRTLAEGAERRTLARGETLFKAGEIGDVGYVLASGRLELICEQPRKRLATLLPGALVGELALLVDLPRSCAARAIDPTELLVLPRALFRAMLASVPEAAVQLRDLFQERVETTLSDLDALRRERLEGPPPARRR